MPIEQIVVLALIQGITEFLPISSSGHLILVPTLTGWPDQGILADVMVPHGFVPRGRRLFLARLRSLLKGTIDLLRGSGKSTWGRLALLIPLGTIPAVVLGSPRQLTGFMDAVRFMPQIVAWNAIIFGIMLYLCDRYGHCNPHACRT